MADEVLGKLRRLCLALPETTETDSWGHPNFRAGKRTFVAFEWIKGRPSIAFMVGADEADQLLMNDRLFFSTPYGRGKWVSVWSDDAVDWSLVEHLIDKSYRQVALKRMIKKLDEKT